MGYMEADLQAPSPFLFLSFFLMVPPDSFHHLFNCVCPLLRVLSSHLYITADANFLCLRAHLFYKVKVYLAAQIDISIVGGFNVRLSIFCLHIPLSDSNSTFVRQ